MSVVRQFLRPRWFLGHVLVVVALLVCLRLAWWQFDRSEESDGTLQNLGYAVLWPLFGLAFVYMWIRFLVLERQRAAVDDAAAHDAVQRVLTEADEITLAAAPPEQTPASAAPSIDPVIDDADDPELAAYNRALAALAEEDRRAR